MIAQVAAVEQLYFLSFLAEICNTHLSQYKSNLKFKEFQGDFTDKFLTQSFPGCVA